MSQELAQSLFSDLRSQDPAIRFSVLSRIENVAWTAELRNAFAFLTQTESDPTIKLYMRLITERVGKSSEAADRSQVLKEFEDLLGNPETDPMRFVLTMESLDNETAKTALATLRTKRLAGFPALILPFILRFIHRHRAGDMIAEVETLCRHSDPQVLAAAVEALEKLAPQKLEPLLVPLLTNENHVIRSKAVRILYRLDPQEALRHFEAMLFSEDRSEKDAAMFHAYFFPFDKIESLLLRFLAIETSAELIKKAGYLFQVNPDLKPPLNLIEIMEGSKGARKEMFSEILRGVLIARSRLLARPVEELLEQLKAAYREKKGNELVSQCRLCWETASAAQRQAIVGRLEELAKTGHAGAKDAIESFAKISTASEKPAATVRKSINELDEQQRMEVWQAAADLQQHHDAIVSLWPHMGPEEKTLILGRVLQNKVIKTANAIGQQALQDQNGVVAAAAIELLAHIDTDTLFPQLPKLLNHSSEHVQSAAIKVYAQYDKDQAVRLLEKMLTQSAAARSSALFHLAQFDFPAVHNILLNCLKLENDEANLQKIEAILASNIDNEILYQVFKNSRNEKGSRKSALEHMFSRLAEAFLSRSDDRSLTLVSLIENLNDRLNKEKQKEANAPAYSLENIKKLRSQVKTADKPVPAVEDENLFRFAVTAFLGSGLAAGLIWLLILAPLLPQPPVTEGNRIRPGESIIAGKVEKVMSSGIQIKATGKNEPVLITLPKVRHGEKFRARVRQSGTQSSQSQSELVELLADDK